jgi:hypothetical protein
MGGGREVGGGGEREGKGEVVLRIRTDYIRGKLMYGLARQRREQMVTSQETKEH